MNITDIKGRVQLHNSSEMPYFGLGVFKSEDGQQVIDAVNYALAEGYRLIDTAAIYGNEAGVGKAIRESSIAREEIFVTSKLWNAEQGYESTLKACDKSLETMGLDYLDLYLIHWPVKGKYNDTWKAMVELYNQGKVKAIGVSNFLQFQLEDLLHNSDVVPVVNQMEFHPRLVQQDLIDFCNNHKIRYQAWSPLMQGKIFEIPELAELGKKYNKTAVQIVLRWNLQMGVTTIPKSVKQERIKSNADIFDFSLTDEEVKMICALDQGKRIGPDPANFDF
ncbi:MAG: aldo/keto reductase [Rhodothermaceae bacterium]